MHKLSEVIGAPRFGAVTKGAVFCPAEGLASDDCSGNTPIDIAVIGNDKMLPFFLFPSVKGLDS